MDAADGILSPNSTAAPGVDDDAAGAGLSRALATTFSLIIFGYFAARFKWLPPPELGLAQFIGRVALPSLVFNAIATLDIETVEPTLVIGIAAGKTIVFAIVAAITYAVNRKDPDAFAKAGIRGIFVTQSNDFALGLPLLAALYPPNMTRYLYVAAPISFLWLNLIAFSMMEYSNRSGARAAADVGPTGKRALWLVVLIGVATNPIIFMTVLGVIFNLSFTHELPAVIEQPFAILANAFSAGALVMLGMSMAGRMFYLRGPRLLVALILILMKTLILPIATKTVMHMLDPGDTYNANFAFIIATFPTAPGVLAFAMQYHVEPVQVASMVVLCTLLSAPIMFIMAKLALLPDQAEEVRRSASSAAELMGTASTSFCLVTMALFMVNRRLKYRLDRAVFSLCVGTLFYTSSEISCDYDDITGTIITVRHGLSYFGWIATMLGVVVYAATLHSLGFGNHVLLSTVTVFGPAVAWMVAAVGATCIMAGLEPTRLSTQCYFREESNLGFVYLAAKIVFPLITLVAAAIVAAKRAGSGDLWGDGADSDFNGDSSAQTSAATDDSDGSNESDPLLQPDRVRDDTDTSLQPLQDSSEQAEEADSGRHTSSRLISTGTAIAMDFVHVSDFVVPVPNRLGPAEFKHSVYLVYEVLALILAAGHAALSFGENVPYELEWVDVFFNASRGVVLFLCFGTDDRLWNTIALFCQPVVQAVRALVFQTETEDLQRCREWLLLSTDSDVSQQECSRCLPLLIKDRASLEQTRSYGLRKYTRVFSGKQLVDWMLERQLACDRDMAEMLGRRLLMHGYFAHVTNEHHFADKGYFYRFGDLDAFEKRLSQGRQDRLLPGNPVVVRQRNRTVQGLTLTA